MRGRSEISRREKSILAMRGSRSAAREAAASEATPLQEKPQREKPRREKARREYPRREVSEARIGVVSYRGKEEKEDGAAAREAAAKQEKP